MGPAVLFAASHLHRMEALQIDTSDSSYSE